MIKQGRKELAPEVVERLIRCFEQFKAEDDDRLEDDTVFVRTTAFVNLEARQASRNNTVLLGRKGDGKTALLRRLAHDLRVNGKLPNGERAVEIFRHIDMEDTYFTELIAQFHHLTTAIQTSHPNIPSELIAKKLWSKYLMLVALRVACRQVGEMHKAGTSQIDLQALEDYEVKVLSELGAGSRWLDTAEVSQGFLAYVKGLVRKFSLSDTALAAGLSQEQRQQAREPMQALNDLPEEFMKCASLIGGARLHLTIALDRFDDFVDRLVSNDLSATRLLRRHFLHGLVSALHQVQRRPEFQWLQLIASLPEDLVIDLDLREMAVHQRRLFVRIAWTVQDLREMLNSRVASVLPGTTWTDLFPFQVANANKRVQRKESSNDYLIRHTSRRPRELMTQALGLFEYLRTTGKPIDSKTMNALIADSNTNIVETQIIPEWRTVLPALRTVIERLHRTEPKTVFAFSELQQSGVAPALIHASSTQEPNLGDEAKTLLALSSLFRVGIIGFRVRRVSAREGYIRQGESDFVRYVFSYTGSQEPITDVTSLLLNPKLRELIDQDQGRAIRALLADGRQAKYDIQLCFSPMYFESLGADHDFAFVIDEINDNQEAA